MSIGYYVHHVGHGHRHRATALARHLAATGGPSLTGLSSSPRPRDWPGEWIELARDDAGTSAEDADRSAVTAGGRLHWVPRRDEGLLARTAQVSAWLAEACPQAMVVDVSVEVALLVRLHGIPVVSVVLPGRRDDDAHRLGFDVADALVAFWPPQARGMVSGLGRREQEALHCVGALSRFAVTRDPQAPEPCESRTSARRQAVLLLGSGGHADVVLPTGRWSWTVVGGSGGWVEDPQRLIKEAAVVVTHAGQNALAEVAAARRPAVVVPQERPHEEQLTTGSVLARTEWPAVVLDDWPSDEAPLDAAAALDGRLWEAWCDGRAVERFADVVASVARS